MKLSDLRPTLRRERLVDGRPGWRCSHPRVRWVAVAPTPSRALAAWWTAVRSAHAFQEGVRAARREVEQEARQQAWKTTTTDPQRTYLGGPMVGLIGINQCLDELEKRAARWQDT